MKTWKTLLLSICVAFSLFVFVGTFNLAFNIVGADQTNYDSVTDNKISFYDLSLYKEVDPGWDWLYLHFDSAVTDTVNYELSSSVLNDIKINGQTIGEFNAASDQKIAAVWGETEANIGALRLVVPTTLVIERLQIAEGFTTLNGKTLVGNVDFYRYSENGMDKFIMGVEPNGQTVELDYMSMYLNQNNGSHFLYMNFKGDITDKPSSNVYTMYFYDYITINGKTLGEIIALTPDLIGVEYPTTYQLLIRIFYEKLDQDEVIKFDGTDVISIKSGFTGLNGVSTDKDYTFVYYNKNGMNDFIEHVESTGSPITVLNADIYPQNPVGYDSVYINFDKVIGEEYNRVETRYIYDYIKINGKTLGEIKANNYGMSVLWNPGNPQNLLIYLKAGVETGLRLDGTDRVEVLEGFVGQNGCVTEEKFDKIYYNGSMVEPSTVAGRYEFDENIEDGENVNLKVRFLLARKTDGASVDLSKITFNGATLSGIDGATAVWKSTGEKTVLSITIPKSSFAEQNKLAILSGLSVWDNIAIGEDVKLKYNKEYNYWMEDTGFVFQGEEIKVSSVGEPRILSNGDFALPITFDKTLTDIRLQNFTDQFKTLLEKSASGEVGYYYDAQLVETLVLKDLPFYTTKNIKINGVALKDYQNFSVSMYGNEIMIVISKTSTKAITDISTNISVEVCTGFRSMADGVVESDVKYTYAYEKNEWVNGDYVSPELPKEKGCSAAFNCQLLWVVALIVPVAFIYRKKHGVR